MNKYSKSRTSLFLIELIISLLFFSLASAICVKFFVEAHLIGVKTRELNNAVAISQGIAEIMRGTDGSLSGMVSIYPNAIEGDDSYFEVFYDSDFKPCSHEDAYYVSDVTVSPNGAIQNISIKVVRLNDLSEIYTLEATKYMNTPKG